MGDRLIKFMLKVGLLYKNSRIDVEIAAVAPLDSIFEQVKTKFEIEGTSEEFLFWHKGAYVVDRNPLGSIQFVPNYPKDIIIIEKKDYEFMTRFQRRITPSLIVETALLNTASRRVLKAINGTHKMTKQYSDPDVMANCISVVPAKILDEDDPEQRIVLLAKWYKEEFFQFVKTCPCRVCGNPDTVFDQAKSNHVTRSERADMAERAEVYRCGSCGALTRFPRYNSVIKLLETHKGRCGELANCFCAILKSLGYDARLVYDFSDHIWVEYWSDEKQRYVHVDPCENIIDKPLVYEEGWGKKDKLLWIIAIDEYQCVDVTRRYTRDLDHIIDGRGSLVDEHWYRKLTAYLNQLYQCDLSAEEKSEIERKQKLDDEAMSEEKTESAPEELRPRISGSANQ